MTPGTCGACGRAVVRVQSDSGQLFIVERIERVFVLDRQNAPHLILTQYPDMAIDHRCCERKHDDE